MHVRMLRFHHLPRRKSLLRPRMYRLSFGDVIILRGPQKTEAVEEDDAATRKGLLREAWNAQRCLGAANDQEGDRGSISVEKSVWLHSVEKLVSHVDGERMKTRTISSARRG